MYKGLAQQEQSCQFRDAESMAAKAPRDCRNQDQQSGDHGRRRHSATSEDVPADREGQRTG